MAVLSSFTKASLAALPLPLLGKRSYYRDPKTRSLYLVITDKGTRSFVFYRKIKGRPERLLLGRLDELSIEQARERATEFNTRVAQGWDPREERHKAEIEPTLGESFEVFMTRHARVNLMHADRYEAQFKRYFCTSEYGGLNLQSRRARDVTKADIARVFGSITSEGKPLSANRVLAMISSMFGWCVRAGLLDQNPAVGIRKNSERPFVRDRFLLPEEMPSFFQSLAAHESGVMRDYVLLSLLTGQRRANVLAMKWSEIDLQSRLWRIPKEKTKTRREYIVPLAQHALDILMTRREGDPRGSYVLPGGGVGGHMTQPKNGWKRILMRAEIYRLLSVLAPALQLEQEAISIHKLGAEGNMPAKLLELQEKARSAAIEPEQFALSDLRIHDLRRTLASWQATTGANLVAISKTLNHSNVATTSIYARLQTDPVRQAIQVATDAMFVAGGMAKKAEVINLR